MNNNLKNKLIEFAQNLIHINDNITQRHFSFIVQRNKVLSFGWNKKKKTHPLAFKYGFEYPNIHSEIDAIINFPYTPWLLRKCILVNIRLNIFQQLRMSKPCRFCMKALCAFEFKEIWYSTGPNKQYPNIKEELINGNQIA